MMKYFNNENCSAGTHTFAAICVRRNGVDSMYYVHPDRLGSYTHITNANKQVIRNLHFDPWGNVKNDANWLTFDSTTLSGNLAGTFRFSRGFTGHEHYADLNFINQFLNNGTKSEVTFTWYDRATLPALNQTHLRNRIAAVSFCPDGDTLHPESATHYSYDIHGNVQQLVQDIPALNPLSRRFTKLDYEYDLISGNVNRVWFQKGQAEQFGHRFRYDKLNRIKQMRTATHSYDATGWEPVSDNYFTQYTYDWNGNLLSLQRKDETGTLMHHINYNYTDTTKNRLSGISATGLNSGTYQYDALGNLIRDHAEGLTVGWNALGKVDTIRKNGNILSTFRYSPTGQRQVKATGSDTIYYIHDATGNVMCVYRLKNDTLTATERYIYGSKRLGMLGQQVWITAGGTSRLQDTCTIGHRIYELTDHLGNVTFTLPDRKWLTPNADNELIYVPNAVTYTDYYPFGFPMPRPGFTMGGYRYFFNGQEADNEVLGEGGFQNYGFRMYDTRLARFWGVDPLAKDYPMLTPFQFASCSPVLLVDVDGLEGIENTPGNMEGGVVHTYSNARQSTYVAPKWFAEPNLTTAELQLVSCSFNPNGEIKVPELLSQLELWLDSPAKNPIDFTFKGLANFGYSYVNSPYSLLFGKTISGSSLTPSQQMDAFVDFVPGIALKSLTFSGQIIRTGDGLQGYNKYVKESKKMSTLPKQNDLPTGVKWQTETGTMFQVNKQNMQMLDETNLFLKSLNFATPFTKNLPEQPKSKPKQ